MVYHCLSQRPRHMWIRECSLDRFEIVAHVVILAWAIEFWYTQCAGIVLYAPERAKSEILCHRLLSKGEQKIQEPLLDLVVRQHIWHQIMGDIKPFTWIFTIQEPGEWLAKAVFGRRCSHMNRHLKRVSDPAASPSVGSGHSPWTSESSTASLRWNSVFKKD